MKTLAIIKLDKYDADALKAGMQTAFSELGLEQDFQAGETIVIKPNMLSATDQDKAVTSHPVVFESLVASLRQTGVKISFGDSPAIESPEKVARASGLLEMAEQLVVPMADFTEAVSVDMPEGKMMRKMDLARGVYEADGLVSLAKLKTHALAGMTASIKNQFGVIPGQRKAACHVQYPAVEDFCQMLVDINVYLKPRLYIIDAIVAMEGNGPRNGHPRDVGVVLVSRDPVACDAAGSVLMGFDPASIPTTRLAEQAGLGSSDLAGMQAVLIDPTGDEPTIRDGLARQLLDELAVPDFVKGRLTRGIFSGMLSVGAPVLKRHVLRRPVILPDKCVRCGRCVDACPVPGKALIQSDSKAVPVYDYFKCIRCYCCQEICPAGAIDVKSTLLGRLFNI